MRMKNNTPQQIDKSHMWVVAMAEDSGKFYGAIVDPKTHKCYVEEMGVSVSKENLTGFFIRIPEQNNDEEWRTAVDFFEKRNVFSAFLEQRDWIWSKKDGKFTKKAERAIKRMT